MSKTMTQAADLAAQADKRRAKLEAEQAELDRLEAEAQRAADREQTARAAAAHDWWTARGRGFHDRVKGRVDAAWKVFYAAVRDGGDTIAAWREYRIAVREVAEDRLSIDEYFHRWERDGWKRQSEHYHRAAYEAMTLSSLSLKIGRDISRAEFDDRLAAWRQGTDAYRSAYADGDPVTDDDLAAALAQRFLEQLVIPVPGPEPYKLGTAAGEAETNRTGRRGITSYTDAVDQVVADLEAEATAAATAQRHSDLEQYVDAQVNAAR